MPDPITLMWCFAAINWAVLVMVICSYINRKDK